MKKRIVITGANGQLGNEMRLLAGKQARFEFDFTDIQDLDLCDAEAVSAYFASKGPAYLVNCAAYTNVNKAESEEALAYQVNRDAIGNLARAAAENATKVLHVSTDYVFDGKGKRPYREDDAPCPASVYGRSKLAGEQVLRQYCPDSVIVRTAWLYSSFGNNFVKTMLRLGAQAPEVRVVADQVGTPTYAGDLAKALMQIILSAEEDAFVPGIYHFTNEGICSWYDFAREIFARSGINTPLTAISTDDYPTPAQRPAYSVLDKSKIKNTYGLKIPEWQESLAFCLQLLK